MDRMTQHAKGMRRYRGAALAEMAIVLTLLLMVTLGAIEYGWAFYCVQRVTNAARHGARVEAAADATLNEGVLAMEALLPASEFPGRVCSVVPDGDFVRATVFVPNESIRLVHWDFLPIPDLNVVVRMAKEKS